MELSDYSPPDFLIDVTDLVVEVGDEAVSTTARLGVHRNGDAPSNVPLRLDGEGLDLVDVALDGKRLGSAAYRVEKDALVLPSVPDRFALEVVTEVDRANEGGVYGLRRSGGVLHTHCEPQGFRRLTYYPDRPDVLARFTTTIVADRHRYPVLLSNGNPTGRGLLPDDRHWARWHDPHPKPSYLFAFIAGDLYGRHDRFVTRSGRDVALAIWSESPDPSRSDLALAALTEAMRWDEEANGLEYDLDALNVVALSEFPMGGMENKGLLIFEASAILFPPDGATDKDRRSVETAIAHEYFHNWTGNRVTIRDWFQLSLKEGLTVARSRAFTRRRRESAAVRIEEIRASRAAVSQTSGLALRPPSCSTISELFAPHVYEHGAEVLRSVRYLTDDSAFHRGISTFLRRYDGRAATIEDLLHALADAEATDVDVDQVLRWYSEGEPPRLVVFEEWDERDGSCTVTLEQLGRDEVDSTPLILPVTVALLDPCGDELPTRLEGEREATRARRTLVLREHRRSFRFLDVTVPPVVSVRDTVAAVAVQGRTLEQLRFLATRDPDPVSRWDAWQEYSVVVLRGLARACGRGDPLVLDGGIEACVVDVLAGGRGDPAHVAEMLTLPGITAIAGDDHAIDVDAAHAALSYVRAELARRCRSELLSTYRAACGADDRTAGHRALQNACLTLLVASADDEVRDLALRQFDAATMTEVVAALAALIELEGPEGQAALDTFYASWKDEPAVLDTWFAVQARGSRTGTVEGVAALARHPAFDPRNPPRVNALVLTFSTENPLHFHRRDGSGYAWLAEQVLEIDPVNAPLASRLAVPLTDWRRHDSLRASKMRDALQRLLAAPDLSTEVSAVVRRGLADAPDRQARAHVDAPRRLPRNPQPVVA